MATTKTRRGFGNVRQLPSGRWQAWYRLNGEHHTAGRTFRNVTEARDFLTTVQADVLRGDWTDNRRVVGTFGEFAEAWFKRRNGDAVRPLAPTTAAKYRRLLDDYLLPGFKGHKLTGISSEQVREWYEAIARPHPSTAADAYRLLATIFNAAIKGTSHKSPCDIDGATRARADERPIIEPAEFDAAVAHAPEQYRAALMLAAWCQLRRGEILGLQRRDVDLSEGSVTIRRAWLLTSDYKAAVGPPKSDAGKRTVYMPPATLEAVRAHLERHTGPSADAWLFERNGRPVLPRTLERAWERARTEAGRPDLHLHDLRHSGATWTAQNGATTAELMERLGHASPVAAARYQHASRERQKELAARLGRMVPNGDEQGSNP